MNQIIGILVLCLIVYAVYRSIKKKNGKKQAAKPQHSAPKAAASPKQPVTPLYIKPTATPAQAKPGSAPALQAEKLKEKSPHQIRMENAQTMKVTLAGTVAVKARQGYLRKIAEGAEPFAFCGYGIEQTEYKGEPAFKVYADMMGESADKVLGMVPAAKVQSVLSIYPRIIEVDVDVYGGPEYEGDEKFYGASATIYYDEK